MPHHFLSEEALYWSASVSMGSRAAVITPRTSPHSCALSRVEATPYRLEGTLVHYRVHLIRYSVRWKNAVCDSLGSASRITGRLVDPLVGLESASGLIAEVDNAELKFILLRVRIHYILADISGLRLSASR